MWISSTWVVVLLGCSARLELGTDRDASVGPGTADGGPDAPALADASDARTDLTPLTGRMACGEQFCCAVGAAGNVRCWGSNGYGQLGNGSKTDSDVPVEPLGLSSGATSVSARGQRACAVVNGAAYCWGHSAPTPSGVVGMGSGGASIAVGLEHVCALLTDGRAKCWGANAYGQIGAGSISNATEDPTLVTLPTAPKALAAGADHTCALFASGRVSCWGANTSGTLGNDQHVLENDPAPTAVEVSSLEGVVGIGAARYTTCAINAASEVKCWGQTLGSPTKAIWSPLDIVALVPGGIAHICGITSSGALRCWGQNFGYGVFGDGTATGSGPSGPVELTVVAASGGARHTCAISTAGTAKCWGQMRGSTVVLTPTDVPGW